MKTSILDQTRADGYQHGLNDGQDWGRMASSISWDDGYERGRLDLTANRPFWFSFRSFFLGMLAGVISVFGYAAL